MRNMKFAAQLLVFATVWAPGVCEDFSSKPSDFPSMAPTVPADDGSVSAIVVPDTCNICGEGEVGNSIGIVNLPVSDIPMTCGSLESTASKGGISQADCPGIQALASTACSCSSLQLDPTSPVELGDSTSCQVCGVGKVVSSSGSLNNVPGIGMISCMALANMGEASNIDVSQCESVQVIASLNCQCVPIGAVPVPVMSPAPVDPTTSANASTPILDEAATLTSSPAPVMSPAPVEPTTSTNASTPILDELAPVTSSPAPVMSPAPVELTTSAPASAPTLNETAPFICSICGDGMLVMLPNATVTISSQPNRTCFEYEQAANFGSLPEDQCGLVQLMAATPCGCVPQEPQVEKPEPEPSDPVDEQLSVVPSDMPSLTPTSAPTVYVTPVVTYESCFDDLTDIYILERDLEDPSILRKYVLCPDTKFNIGIVDDNGEISEGQQTIQLRPNVIYQCGEDGKRSNGCILEGGDFGLTSFYGVYNDIYETVENVMIKGLTFQSQQLFSVVLEAAGDISFLECAFFVSGYAAISRLVSSVNLLIFVVV
jgi:hypothetical protein